MLNNLDGFTLADLEDVREIYRNLMTSLNSRLIENHMETIEKSRVGSTQFFYIEGERFNFKFTVDYGTTIAGMSMGYAEDEDGDEMWEVVSGYNEFQFLTELAKQLGEDWVQEPSKEAPKDYWVAVYPKNLNGNAKGWARINGPMTYKQAVVLSDSFEDTCDVGEILDAEGLDEFHGNFS